MQRTGQGAAATIWQFAARASARRQRLSRERPSPGGGSVPGSPAMVRACHTWCDSSASTVLVIAVAAGTFLLVLLMITGGSSSMSAAAAACIWQVPYSWPLSGPRWTGSWPSSCAGPPRCPSPRTLTP
jgi:hypothetical protein